MAQKLTNRCHRPLKDKYAVCKADKHALRRNSMNILQGLTHAKKIAGTHQAIVCGDHRYTWNEFDQRTDALARGLASLGIQQGDRIAVMMLNCHRYLELYYACARMGAVIVPLNIRLARSEIVSGEC